MRYPVVIHKDPGSEYGVTVPDLPGCFSAGATMDEALLNAVEAIECHLEGMLIDGEAVPAPKTVEQYRDNPDYAGGVWALVPVDLSKLSGKARRVNITLPERVLNILDKYAGEAGESRSGLIAQAALEYVAARAQATYPMVIEEVTRNSIRRNDEVVGQSTESLYTIQGIGATFERKLKEAGIESTEALLKVGAPPKGREEIAVKAGIGDKLILEWVNHIELYRIRGVASEYSDLLEAAGVDTVVELAQCVPANLFAKMAEVNQAKKLVRKMPTKKQVSDWIAQAKILPRIVED